MNKALKGRAHGPKVAAASKRGARSRTGKGAACLGGVRKVKGRDRRASRCCKWSKGNVGSPNLSWWKRREATALVIALGEV